jgi:putative acetyltransferase
MISIVPYDDSYHSDFKRLNLEWLEKYDICEQYDLDVLNDPFGQIIAPGGCLFVAKENDIVVGTAGLAKGYEEGVYELVKMAVDPVVRGKGFGKMLLEKCIEEAKQRHARKISLFSNSQLVPALTMYEKFGFKHVPVTDSFLLTANVKMELSLSSN